MQVLGAWMTFFENFAYPIKMDIFTSYLQKKPFHL